MGIQKPGTYHTLDQNDPIVGCDELVSEGTYPLTSVSLVDCGHAEGHLTAIANGLRHLGLDDDADAIDTCKKHIDSLRDILKFVYRVGWHKSRARKR